MASVKFGSHNNGNNNYDSTSSSINKDGKSSNASSFYHNRYGNTDETRRTRQFDKDGALANVDPTAVFDLETAWFNAKFPVKKCTIKDIATFKIDSDQIQEYYRAAQTAMENETDRLARLDHKRWAMDHFQQRGTVADRIASAALELSNPAQITARSLNAFTVLFDIAQHDSHHFDAALNALVAVWPRLLPPRPLRKFSAQYFATLPDEENKRNFVLVHWLLEDLIKRTYTQFLSLAESCLKDRLTQRRESWLNACGRLLPRVTEGRPTLIALIVDKLGDPNTTMAHKAYHQLLDMLCESSTYQSVLLTELEKLSLANRSTTTKGRAYCIQVLAQFVFNKDEQKLALKVIEVYLGLLRHQLAAGAADYSSTTAIIVGMRRAFPYAGTNFAVLEEHVDTLFAFAATGPFLQRIHALSLVHQLFTKGWKSLEHRFYRALYASLLVPSAQLPHSSQLAGYFTLLFKSLRQDASLSSSSSSSSAAASAASNGNNSSTSKKDESAVHGNEHSERIAAFIHRMLQQCAFHNEAYVCSMLLMVGEFSRVSPLVAELLSPTAASPKQQQQQQQQKNNKDKKQQAAASAAALAAAAATVESADEYDAKNRDPRFANLSLESIAKSKSSCYFELNLLASHSHPSVARLAKSLLTGDVIAFDVHPLDDLTLVHFLDMVTEGKTTSKKRPESEGKGVPVFHRNPHVPMLPKASDAAFAKAHPSAVDPNSLFLHRFAHQRLKFLNDTKPKWKDAVLLHHEAERTRAKIVDNRDAHFGPQPKVGTAQPADVAAGADGTISKQSTVAPATNGSSSNDTVSSAKPDQQKHQAAADRGDDEEFVEFNWGRIEDDEAWQEHTSKKLTRKEERNLRYGIEPNEDGDDDDDDEDDFDYDDDDGDAFPDFGQHANDDDDEDSYDDEDDDEDDDEFGDKGEADADAADDFDEELMETDNKLNDRRRRRERAWLDKATGETPTTPFNTAGKKKKQQTVGSRQGGGMTKKRR